MALASPQVAILMATYNGARYLREQVLSVVAQSWPHWHLFVRDDGSQDDSVRILAELAEQYVGRVTVLPHGGERLGADGNFSRLLVRAEADYFMFCDQDDVWMPHKIESSLRRIKELEGAEGVEAPLLVHTDLKVVDGQLQELDSSVWHYGHHDPNHGMHLNRLLVQNMVFGCSILINRALRQIAAPIPEGVVQYDWWLALVAVCLGRIGYVSEPTMLYRQHGANTVGARRFGLRYVLGKAFVFADLRNALAASQKQASILLSRYEHRLSDDQRQILRAYSELGRQGFFKRRWLILRHGFLKTGWVRNVGLLARV
jgi:glycosyltransferase involved in cell wall biosynthesis